MNGKPDSLTIYLYKTQKDFLDGNCFAINTFQKGEMKMKKKLITAVLTATMALTMSMTALAGQWTNDSIGWHYDKTGYGNFAASEWLWIDGNNDGIVECYCFDSTSFMYANTTTPDGYTVDEMGHGWLMAWYRRSK